MLKRFFLAVLFALAVLAPATDPPRITASPRTTRETQDCVVYVTRTGHRYHRAGCRYLRYSSFRTTRARAIAAGLTPCKVCGGSDCER